MKISVIIPIYKVEQYLCQCIDSVLVQTYTDLEIILVDDGSPDGCGAICDRYARQDPRIRVIHQENKGLSEARNAGTEIATGEYVIFLDSDDLWTDPGAMTRLAARVQRTRPDVLHYSYVRWFEDTGKKQPYFSGVPAMPALETRKEQLDYLTGRGLFIASACNKLVRRELLDRLSFRPGVYSEDIEWCAQLLLAAGTMDFVCENFYLYRQRASSIRHTIGGEKCADLADNILACANLIGKAGPGEREALLRYTAYQYGTFFAIQAAADAFPEEAVQKLAPYAWLLKHHGGNRKLRILRLGCCMLGYRGLCRACRVLYGKQ